MRLKGKRFSVYFFTSNKIKNNKVANIFKAPTIETDETQEIHICLGHYLCQEIEKFKL